MFPPYVTPHACNCWNLPSSLGAPGEDSESDELPPGPSPAEALPTASFSHFFLFFGGGSAFTFEGLALGSREVVDCPVARLRSVRICRPLVARSLRKGRVTLSFSFSTGRGGDGFSGAGGSGTAGSGVGSGGLSGVIFSGVSGLGGGAETLDGGAELPPTEVGPLVCPDRLEKDRRDCHQQPEDPHPHPHVLGS